MWRGIEPDSRRSISLAPTPTTGLSPATSFTDVHCMNGHGDKENSSMDPNGAAGPRRPQILGLPVSNGISSSRILCRYYAVTCATGARDLPENEESTGNWLSVYHDNSMPGVFSAPSSLTRRSNGAFGRRPLPPFTELLASYRRDTQLAKVSSTICCKVYIVPGFS